MNRRRAMQSKVAVRMAAAFAFGAVVGSTALTVSANQKEQVIPEPKVVYIEKLVEREQPEQVQEKTYTYFGKYKVTAYCACETCCGEWAKNRPVDSEGKPIVNTASGERAAAGVTVAVDPSVIAYGTELMIAGHTYTAQDCGGAIKGNRIDVYFDSHSDAKNYGVQMHDVYIVQ